MEEGAMGFMSEARIGSFHSLKTWIEEGSMLVMAMNARVHCLREEGGDDPDVRVPRVSEREQNGSLAGADGWGRRGSEGRGKK